jgi:Tfp pilus assembly protein PilO
MKLPKNYFQNLSTASYREYLKLLPEVKKEHTKALMMLIFTFVALSFFGIFAIRPTILTIIELQKQLTDDEFVLQQLTTKINNLSQLQQQYTTITLDIPLVYDAIPQSAAVGQLSGQLEALAKKHALTITELSMPTIELSGKQSTETHADSYLFSLQAEGNYLTISSFIADLVNFNRLVTIESLTLSKAPDNDILIVQIQGRAYFKK